MKRTITLRFLLSLCVLTLCSFLGGKELTITAATTVELNTKEYGSSQNWIPGSSTTLTGKTITFNDVISMTYDKGTATSDPYYRTWSGTNCFYSRKGSSFTISAIEGYYITEISFTTNSSLSYDAESGSLSPDKTKWTAEEGEKTNAIKFSCTGNTYITCISVTYESQVSDSKGDSQLTIESEVSIDYKESYTVKATASDKDGNPISGNITYTIISSASSDYTFDEGTGVFTAGTTPGSYTVEASYAANNDYNASSAQCVITVMEPGVSSWKDYRLVTEQSQVVEGAQYILVCPIVENEYNSLYTMGSIDPNGYAYSYNAGYYALSNNGISSTVESSVMPFILEKVNGNFALKTLDGQYLKGFIGWYGMTYDIELGSSNSASEAQWSIEIDQDGNAHIYNIYDNSQALMYRADVQQFKNYSHSSYGTENNPAVKLYAKCAEMSIKQEALGYGTYAVDFAYQMPKGVKGYAINAVNDGVEDETKKLVKSEAYAEETDVPMLTPLLVYSEEAAAASKTYYPIVIYKDVEAYEGDNYLEYKRNGGMTASKQEEPVYYYKLTKKASVDPAEHKPLGFYWGAEKGEAFSLNNTSSAYLALPKSLFDNGSLASALLFDEEGQATGIQLTPTTENNTQAIYNLQGVRVSGKLAKGIYIVNGKKVYVK